MTVKSINFAFTFLYEKNEEAELAKAAFSKFVSAINQPQSKNPTECEKAPEKMTGDIAPPEAPKIDPKCDEMLKKFLQSGDISEIQASPGHREAFKHYSFVQLNGIKGRTIYAARAANNKPYIGILPPALWGDDVVEELTKQLQDGNTINCVILDDGNRPSLILDAKLNFPEWSSRGRVFNSLYHNSTRLK